MVHTQQENLINGEHDPFLFFKFQGGGGQWPNFRALFA